MKAPQISVLHTLLVERDRSEADVYSRHIASSPGFSLVGVAETSEQALHYLETSRIDLLVIEQSIGSMTGLELLLHIRHAGHEVDAMLISPVRERSNLQMALRYGAVDYLVKPVGMERFFAALYSYRERVRKINGLDSLEQTDIDSAIHTPCLLPGLVLPKGLDPVTLAGVRNAVSDFKREFSTQDLAIRLGISRVTARKYLDYLKKLEEIDMRLEYRVAGRPLTLFRSTRTD